MDNRQLPDKLLVFENPDKQFHEKWTGKRKKLNIPHPFRVVIMAKPNTGKTTIAKNLLFHASPRFERLILVHHDAGFTKEYNDSKPFESFKHIPTKSDFDGKKKTLVIMDDINFKRLSKNDQDALNRLYGYVSTHKNVSVIANSQDAFDIPPVIRRMSNFWILGLIDDIDSLATAARKTGIKKEEFKYLFDTYLNGPHDTIWIDKTANTPYPLRLNGTTILSRLKTS